MDLNGRGIHSLPEFPRLEKTNFTVQKEAVARVEPKIGGRSHKFGSPELDKIVILFLVSYGIWRASLRNISSTFFHYSGKVREGGGAGG